MSEYGRHLREVVDRHHALPLLEHRSQCRCSKCKTKAAKLKEGER